MLTLAVLGYLLATIAVGVYASTRVKGARDFMVAGRSLPLYMNFTCVFATWFGAETVLSVSATFAKDGLSEIPGDPFGFSVCLILVALFFARMFYRMNLLTIGDFYRQRYGRTVEVGTSLVIAASYIGWAAAQMTALGLVLTVLGQAAGWEWLTLNQGIVIGVLIVLFYTALGGMWAVALTDVIQTAVIVVGLITVAFIMADQAGGATQVIQSAHESGRLRLLPRGGGEAWITFVAGFVTAALGSIPQQDVFQRVTSAKDERTAVRGTLLGGGFYFLFAFVPMFIAYAALLIDPDYLQLFGSEDPREVQRVLPELILDRTPFWVQVIFLGALVSAILSTASGTLLAPTSLFVENVIRPLFPRLVSQGMLGPLRLVLVAFAGLATWQAVGNSATMYEMVQGAYSVPLVGALVPLAAGMYWKRATTAGALASLVGGVTVWLAVMYGLPEFPIPPQLCGLAASLVAMISVSLVTTPTPAWQLSEAGHASRAADPEQFADPPAASDDVHPPATPQ